ncbi:MAG TPA: ATP-binding protein [Candidatus Baltobacteraceae bacterium]|nr:ATP-binding protein [Candidatus Baltobacteraceae bacterium]
MTHEGIYDSAVPGGRSLRVRIPPNARFSRNVRHQVLSFAGNHEISDRELEEFIFAVGEALANAIEHSRTSDVIEVHCQIEDDKIVATILDSGAGFPTDPVPNVSLPDPLTERGRGLPIMRRCTDIFAVHSVPGRGTAVVLGRYLRRKRRENTDQETHASS